jgi:hypothetical protein
MLDEHAPFFERALVQQDFKPFARGQLPLRVLGLDPLLAAADASCLAMPLELV